MSPLLGPILAQLVTLGVADRTEVRYVVVDQQYVGGGRHAELGTAPRVALNFGWRHAALTVSYGPSITVTPLEAKDSAVLVFHSGTVAGSYRWARTTMTVSESLGYGKVDYQVQALADPRTVPVTSPTSNGTPTGGAPTPPANGSTPGPPTTGGTGAQPQPGPTNPNLLPASGAVQLGSSVTAVNISQLLSAVLTVSAGVSYAVSGAVGADPRNFYPTVKSEGAQVSAAYSPTRDDSLTTSLASQFAATRAINSTPPGDNHAWVLVANEAWAHRLDKQTSTRLGSGLSLSRNSQPNGLVSYSVYPNFVAGITHSSLLGRSTLTLGSNVASAPYIDPVRALVDPSLSAGAFAGLGRDRFSSTLTAGTAVSVVTHGNNGALNSISSALTVSYRLGAGFSVDSGLRAAWQSFGGFTTIPPSVAAFAGITMGAQVPLSGGH